MKPEKYKEALAALSEIKPIGTGVAQALQTVRAALEDAERTAMTMSVLHRTFKNNAVNCRNLMEEHYAVDELMEAARRHIQSSIWE